MAEYYGVTRTPEYLMHYGVKGMRWGVRKAKESGSDKKLWRQYEKAHKKLSKLSIKADIGRQKSEQMKYAKAAAGGLAGGLIGASGVVGAGALTNRFTKNINKAHDVFYGGMDNRVQRMIKALNAGDQKAYDAIQKERSAAYQNYVNAKNSNFNNIDHSERAKAISAGLALGALGYGGYAAARSLAAKRRQTPEGHAKAVAKRDAWQKEMKAAFKGTKYANSTNPEDFGKEYYKRNKKKLDKAQKRWDAYDKKTNNRRFRQRHD